MHLLDKLKQDKELTPESAPSISSRGQSFLELAIILPVLLILVIGLSEVAFFTGRYLDALDLTREAARFASLRDPFPYPPLGDYNCSTTDALNFYYDTACIFSPTIGSNCANAAFCNGFNPYIPLDMSAGKDDVVIEAFTLIQDMNPASPTYLMHIAEKAWPTPDGYWALSNVLTPNSNSWKTDCRGHVVLTQPYFTIARVNQFLLQDANTPTSKGYVAVEFYYCYHQVLNLPIISQLIPNPARIHVYTLMSLPAAAPTATPIP